MSNPVSSQIPFVALAMSAFMVGPVLAQDSTNTTVQVGKVNINRVVTDVKLLNNRNFVVPETSGKAEELVDQGR